MLEHNIAKEYKEWGGGGEGGVSTLCGANIGIRLRRVASSVLPSRFARGACWMMTVGGPRLNERGGEDEDSCHSRESTPVVQSATAVSCARK